MGLCNPGEIYLAQIQQNMKNSTIFPPAWLYRITLVIACCMALGSLAGLLFQSAIYPTEELRRSFTSNDVVNLALGLPLLLGSLWLARRGELIGLLFWPGAIFFVMYNSIAYSMALAFTWMFAFHLGLVILSLITIAGLYANLDAASLSQRLQGAVPRRLAGGILAGLGGLFLLLSIGKVIGLFNGQALSRAEQGVLLADFISTPIWIIAGVALWRKQAFGYLSGAGVLFQASMLFVGLLVFFLLTPVLTTLPFPTEDFVVIFAMGLVCFVPFGLFVRGILSVR